MSDKKNSLNQNIEEMFKSAFDAANKQKDTKQENVDKAIEAFVEAIKRANKGEEIKTPDFEEILNN